MRCLLLHYSLTGETQKGVNLAADTCRTPGWEAVSCRISFRDPALAPHRPFRFADTRAWVKAAADGAVMSMQYQPAAALGRDYDLVLLFTRTWNLHPCVPVNSFLHDPQAAGVLAGRPFGIYVICRRSWERNAEIVRTLGETAGRRCIGVEHFSHHGSQVGSLIETVTHIHATMVDCARCSAFACRAMDCRKNPSTRWYHSYATCLPRRRAIPRPDHDHATQCPHLPPGRRPQSARSRRL